MENSLEMLKQDIVFLIKRNLESSFYCKSLDLCQPVHIKISRDILIQNYSNSEIKKAFDNLFTMFFDDVKCNKKPKSIAMLRLVDRISFTESTIYFTTYQFYINKLSEVDFYLNKL